MINKVGRELPDFIEGYGKVRPYEGAFAHTGEMSQKVAAPVHSAKYGEPKLVSSLDEVLDKVGIKDGMTVSFHHHLRNGDKVTNLVMQAIAAKGVKDIHVAASGIFPCHEPLVPLIEDGTITQMSVSTFQPGPVPQAISAGKMKKPAILRSHGGRPRSVESGEMHIDVCFIAAPTCDDQGNMNANGPNACGCLSYSHADARHADYVVAVTDNLVPYPCCPKEISEDLVDYVVTVDSIGDPNGIATGAMKVTEDPDRLAIAQRAADFIEAAGYIKEGMSLQTGVGAISIAVADKVKEKMIEKKIVGSFGMGGITGYFVDMYHQGLFRALLDVQCFDLDAIKDIETNPGHMIMSASQYASPGNKGCAVNQLDIILLGGFEIDVDFNVNVNTGSNGVIMSSSGGNADTAAGSKLSIIVSDLMKKGNRCLVKDKVITVTTPGETVDVLVTDKGIAVNPRRTDILEKLKGTDLPLVDIHELYKMGQDLGAVDEHPEFEDRIVGVVEYRDGTVTDVIRQVK